MIVEFVSFQPTEFCHECLVQRCYHLSLLDGKFLQSGHFNSLLAQIIFYVDLDTLIQLVDLIFEIHHGVFIDERPCIGHANGLKHALTDLIV